MKSPSKKLRCVAVIISLVVVVSWCSSGLVNDWAIAAASFLTGMNAVFLMDEYK